MKSQRKIGGVGVFNKDKNPGELRPSVMGGHSHELGWRGKRGPHQTGKTVGWSGSQHGL